MVKTRKQEKKQENERKTKDMQAFKSKFTLAYSKENNYYITKGIIYSVSSTGEKNIHSTLPSELASQIISIWDNPDKVWVGDGKGIANYDLSGESITVLYDKGLTTHKKSFFKIS